mmetsp:Transcript_9349/g.9165  ORF Transcript_9349/g.9165 Transcript_9349/m.9165 type:complete len:487 (+) Transcript_9349:1001-2461(+)
MVGEMGGAALETRRLTYAWRLRHLLGYNAERQKAYSDILQALQVLFTMLSTLAAVVHSYMLQIGAISGGTGVADGYGFVALNLLLPLAVTVLRGLIATLSPLSKYSILYGTAMKVESEIYLYRTHCGKYNSRKAAPTPATQKRAEGNEAQDKHKDEDKHCPRKVFSASLDQIWRELASSDISKGSLMTPPQDQDPLDKANALIYSNIRQQNILIATLKEHVEPIKSRNNEKKIKKNETFFSFFFKKKNLNNFLNKKRLSLVAPDGLNKQKKRFSFVAPTMNTFQLKGEAYDIENPPGSRPTSGKSRGGMESNWGGSQMAENETIGVIEVGEKSKDKGGVDDGVSMLTADEYIVLRLTPQLANFMVKTPPLHRFSISVTAIIIIFSVFSSILSTFGFIQFIPAVFAVSGAFTAWTSYSQTDLVLIQTNAAINQLNQLIIWWDALSMIEKRIGANKEFLVVVTELAIQSQVVGYASKGQQKDDNNEDT